MFLSVSATNEQIISSTIWVAIVTTIGAVFQVTQLASKEDVKSLAAEVKEVKTEVKEIHMKTREIHLKTSELTTNTATKQQIKDFTTTVGTAVVYVSDEVTALSADKLKKDRSEFLAKLFTTK